MITVPHLHEGLLALEEFYSRGGSIGPPQGPFWRPDRGWGFRFHCGLKWRTLGGHIQVKFPSISGLGRPLCDAKFRVPCEAPGGGGGRRTASVKSPCRPPGGPHCTPKGMPEGF
jgi:hypothetical protein